MSGSKLSAKAARLDFSRLPGSQEAITPSAPPAQDVRPKTAPGAMMAFATDARSELVRENEALRQQAADVAVVKSQLHDALNELGQWDGAKAARLIDAKLVVDSRFANRHEHNYSGPEYSALRADIESAGGNVQPIKVRRLAVGDSAAPQYELVFGHRRHRACLELGLPVLAVIDNLDDKALFIEMDRENRARKDLSAWEQGTMYRAALRQGLFPSNRRMAEALGVDLSAVGKALSLADLPDELVAAFASPLDLQFRWAKPLTDALATDRDAVLAAARWHQQQAGRAPAAQVFASLVAAAKPGVEPFHPRASAPVVVTVDGREAAAIVAGASGEVQVTLRAGWSAGARIGELADLIQGFMAQGTPAPTAVSPATPPATSAATPSGAPARARPGSRRK